MSDEPTVRLDEPMFSPLALTGTLPFLPLAQGTIDYQVDRRSDPATLTRALADPRARVMLIKDGLIAVPRGQGVLAKRESAHVRAAMLPAVYLRGELNRIDDAFLAFLGVEHDWSDAGAGSFGSAPAALRSGRQEGSAAALRSGRQGQDDDFGGTPYLALILSDRKYRSRRAAQGDASDAGTDQTGESDDGTSLGAQSGRQTQSGLSARASASTQTQTAAQPAPAQTQASGPASSAEHPGQSAGNPAAGYPADNPDAGYPTAKPMIDRLTERFDWVDLRDFAPKTTARDAGLATSAVTLSNWQHSQLFCPRCGAPTMPSGSGWTQRCTAFDTGSGDGVGGHLLFPRVEPAVITLVVDAHDRLLIQHNKAWRNPLLYSVSAGFVEAGENLEHAVRRETMEETGVELGELRYLGSQPWPFPGSLMMAFKAQARTTEIHVDGEETADARWVTREELTRLIAMGEVEMPGRAAIARYMIEQWYGMEL